jgi:hypothetical protein
VNCLLLALKPGVGVEKVTSISRIRFNRGVLEEGIRPWSV